MSFLSTVGLLAIILWIAKVYFGSQDKKDLEDRISERMDSIKSLEEANILNKEKVKVMKANDVSLFSKEYKDVKWARICNEEAIREDKEELKLLKDRLDRL
jgi:hypothetical protein